MAKFKRHVLLNSVLPIDRLDQTTTTEFVGIATANDIPLAICTRGWFLFPCMVLLNGQIYVTGKKRLSQGDWLYLDPKYLHGFIFTPEVEMGMFRSDMDGPVDTWVKLKGDVALGEKVKPLVSLEMLWFPSMGGKFEALLEPLAEKLRQPPSIDAPNGPEWTFKKGDDDVWLVGNTKSPVRLRAGKLRGMEDIRHALESPYKDCNPLWGDQPSSVPTADSTHEWPDSTDNYNNDYDSSVDHYDDEDRLGSIDPDLSELSIGVRGTNVLEESEIQAIRAQISDNENKANSYRAKGNHKLASHFQEQADHLNSQLRADTRPGGKSRKILAGDPLPNAMKALHGRLKSVYQRLEKEGLTEICDHLRGSIDTRTRSYSYAPKGSPPKWTLR